jgi:hypothetical protein
VSIVDPYRHIRALLDEEADVMAAYESRTGSSGFGLLKGWAVLRFWKNTQLLNMLAASRLEREVRDDAYRDMPSLAIWTRLALAAWGLILTGFGVLTLADLHLAVFYPAVHQFSKAIGEPFRVGDFWGNLPGRAVAVTFALTCVTYYVNNFALISPKRCGRYATEYVMRACACLLPLPVLWAIFYDPRAWPLCSGVGTLLVVLNNFLALRLTRDAERIGSRFSTRGPEGQRFVLEQFEEWWRLMAAYSVSITAIGILLLTKVAHDEGVYAALVVAINVFKMYRLNCVKLAPLVRGNLLRDIFTIVREERLESLGVERPTADAEYLDSLDPSPVLVASA